MAISAAIGAAIIGAVGSGAIATGAGISKRKARALDQKNKERELKLAEASLAEQQRQFNLGLAEERKQADWDRYWGDREQRRAGQLGQLDIVGSKLQNKDLALQSQLNQVAGNTELDNIRNFTMGNIRSLSTFTTPTSGQNRSMATNQNKYSQIGA